MVLRLGTRKAINREDRDRRSKVVRSRAVFP